MRFSLVDGPIIWITTVLALVLLALSLRPFGWRRTGVAAAVAGATLAIAVVGSHEATAVGWIVPALPWYSDLWVWAVFFTIVWLPIGWRSGRRWSRVTAVVAAPAALLMALVLFNSYFYYFPTFTSLFGSPSVDQASPAELARIRIAAHLRHPRQPVQIPGAAPTRGMTLAVDVAPTTSKFVTSPAWVYLPPAWFGPLRSKLPVIELLGGTPSGPAEWLRGVGVDRFTDDFAARHAGLAPVVVMVDDNGGLTADSECVDRPGAMAETYALLDVRRTMVNRFKVTADPRHWAIAGLSEGGMCALNIAVRHPTAFTTIGNFSGEPRPALRSAKETLDVLFGGSRARQRAYDPDRYLRKFRYPNKHVMFVIGTRDHGRRTAVEQAVLARRAGMQVRFRLVKGGHTFRVWRTAYSEFLPFAWMSLSPPPPPGAPSTVAPSSGTPGTESRVTEPTPSAPH